MPRVALIGGKGGVGKTTVSAALAYALAQRGYRVLAISIDPAHTLGSVLRLQLGGKPTRVVPGLYAMELDAEARFRERLEELRRVAGRLLNGELLRAYLNYLDVVSESPGAEELAVIDELARLVRSDYDYVVVDTAPIGHTAKLLRLPDVLSSWLRALSNVVAMGGVVNGAARLGARAAPTQRLVKYLEARAIWLRSVADSVRSGLVALVATPETIVLDETLHYLDKLRRAGLNPVAGLNKARSDEATRRAEQLLSPVLVAKVPQLEEEPRGLDKLAELSKWVAPLIKLLTGSAGGGLTGPPKRP